MDPPVARSLWRAIEPYHAMIYFAPEAAEALRDAGYRGWWMGYFASRVAPMGAVPAPVVTATFYNFAPRRVERAIPDAWALCPPEGALAARHDAADAALRRLLGEDAAGPAIEEAAALAREATEGCDPAGRALFAGHAAMAWPEPAHLRLWHAATLLREFRGDGHVAALTAEDVDGCEAHVSAVAAGLLPRQLIEPMRGWTDDEWDAAVFRLAERGWVDDAGAFTAAGRAARQAIEDRTDRLALAPCERLGEERCRRLIELARALTTRIVDAGAVPVPNPIGVQRP